MKSLSRFAALALALASPAGIAADAALDRAISTTPSLAVLAKAPDFALLDTAGKPVKLSDYRGRTVLLAFIFTTCPGVCPLISKQMEYLQRELIYSLAFFNEKQALIDIQALVTEAGHAAAR